MQQMNVKISPEQQTILLMIYAIINQFKQTTSFDIDVVPSWRPDKVLKIELPQLNGII